MIARLFKELVSRDRDDLTSTPDPLSLYRMRSRPPAAEPEPLWKALRESLARVSHDWRCPELHNTSRQAPRSASRVRRRKTRNIEAMK